MCYNKIILKNLEDKMSEYIGSKCIICDNTFTKDDDIVVCPDCGTPYHRECYQKEGKCINNILHSKNESWKSTFKKSEDNEEITCSICGEKNPKSGLFCLKCGNPLNNANAQKSSFQQGNIPPFFAQAMNMAQDINEENKFTQDSELDGIKIKEYTNYIGPNPLYYITHFIRFEKLQNKMSVNFGAFLFPSIYFFYRKMYLHGVIYYLLALITYIPVALSFAQAGYFDGTVLADIFSDIVSKSTLEWMLTSSNLLNTILMFSASFFANWFYYRKAKKDIEKIKAEGIIGEELIDKIKLKGGVSPRSAFIAAIIPFVAALITLIVLRII